MSKLANVLAVVLLMAMIVLPLTGVSAYLIAIVIVTAYIAMGALDEKDYDERK